MQGTDLQPVLAAADERDEAGHLANPRTAVLIRLLTLYGLRVSETTWLTFGDLTDGAHGTQLRVRGKGDLVDHVDLDQDTCDALAAWLIERTVLLAGAGLESEDPALPLIVSAAGKRISRQAVADVVARFTERALGRRLIPHSLRKSTAVAFHQAGYSDRDLKRWGRWRTQTRRAPAGRLRQEAP
ncbi:tyrosine-type recombinase/integrase [Nocardiopsis terrae]